MPTQKLTAEIITAAIEGFESQKQRLDSRIDELRQLLHGDRTEAAESNAPRRKRKMSAAGRRRIAAAQKLRWAKIRGEAAMPPSATPPKRKRKMSAAGRKAISDATKKRWALKRAADKKTAGKAKSTAAKRAQKKSKTPEAAAAATA